MPRVIDRIPGALELAPMTIPQLARVLSAGNSTVRHALTELHAAGMVQAEPERTRRRAGPPYAIWRNAA